MRYVVHFVGTIETVAESHPSVPAVDASLTFDPRLDRTRIDATTDELRISYFPAGPNSRPPATVDLLAFPPGLGIVKPGVTAEEVRSLAPLSSATLTTAGFGRFTATLTGLSGSYDLAILTGFTE